MWWKKNGLGMDEGKREKKKRKCEIKKISWKKEKKRQTIGWGEDEGKEMKKKGIMENKKNKGMEQ